MADTVEVDIEGRLGVIALNRPQAINALDVEMVDAIHAALGDFGGDDRVRAVLFEGRGERGFCAGGDVRAARASVVAGRKVEADRFFAHEYRMNGAIAGFAKPIAVIAHGVVMGGGIGIAGHCRFRFTTPSARFAMPESAIGFFGDVGVGAILAKAPRHRALAFLMSGLTVSGADILALGLADCAVAPERLAAVRAGIVAAAASGHVEGALVKLMEAESIQAGERELSALADRLEPAFAGHNAGSILAAVSAMAAGDAGAEAFARSLASRSPTSLVAILESHLAARRAAGIAEVLAADLRLARLMAGLPDFAEGVRAVLIDRDHKPVWSPGEVGLVDRAAIRAALVGQQPVDRPRLSTS